MKQVALFGDDITDVKKAAPADELGPVTYASKGATLSPCGLYRYQLERCWGLDGPCVVWVMLNPSTADADRDDPTVKKCVGFARRWGAGAVRVVNLFAYRATAPEALDLAREGGRDVVGPENDERLGRLFRSVAEFGGRVVAAWGAHETWGRAPEVCAMATRLGVKLEALRLTKKGAPEHPLYVPYDVTPVPFGVP